MNQIQASTQKSAEMKEKIKILANEIEILRTTVTNIEKFVDCCSQLDLNHPQFLFHPF